MTGDRDPSCSLQNIKLIATDLDGTLLDSFGHVSDINLQAIKNAKKCGILTIASTARSIRSTQAISLRSGLGPLAICQNGAAVYDVETKELLYHQPIEIINAISIISKLRTEMPGILFAIEKLENFIPEKGFFPAPLPGLTADPTDEILNEISEPVTKIICRHPAIPHRELKNRAYQQCHNFADITSAGADWVDFQATGISKATGLAFATKLLDIASDEVAAIGDNSNDVPMLEWVTVSAAPSNANAEAKLKASWIVPSNLDNGVAVFIEKIIDSNRNNL